MSTFVQFSGRLEANSMFLIILNDTQCQYFSFVFEMLLEKTDSEKLFCKFFSVLVTDDKSTGPLELVLKLVNCCYP